MRTPTPFRVLRPNAEDPGLAPGIVRHSSYSVYRPQCLDPTKRPVLSRTWWPAVREASTTWSESERNLLAAPRVVNPANPGFPKNPQEIARARHFGINRTRNENGPPEGSPSHSHQTWRPQAAPSVCSAISEEAATGSSPCSARAFSSRLFASPRSRGSMPPVPAGMSRPTMTFSLRPIS